MQFRTLYAELANSTETLRALLSGIPQDAARRRPNTRSWSILEVTCHLYDEEREDFREHLDFILDGQGREWHRINPQGWVKERKYNRQDFRNMRRKFLLEREKSLQWLKGLSRVDWSTRYTSPFGSMSAGDMLASWIAHDNLHSRQLVELRRHRIEAITRPYKIQYAGDW